MNFTGCFKLIICFALFFCGCSMQNELSDDDLRLEIVAT